MIHAETIDTIVSHDAISCRLRVLLSLIETCLYCTSCIFQYIVKRSIRKTSTDNIVDTHTTETEYVQNRLLAVHIQLYLIIALG